MPISSRTRASLLQEVAVCLMRLSESKSAAGAVDALAAFLQSLGSWHAIDVFADGAVHRRLTSHRCPRSFGPFVIRLGFNKRADGSYPGTFAQSTLLLVKAGDPTMDDRCLVGAIGFEKISPLNDGATLGCIGMVMREALARVLWFEAAARRSTLLDVCLDRRDEFALLLDAGGRLIERYPAQGSEAIAAQAAELLRMTQPPRAAPVVELSAGGRVYDVHLRWITTDGPLSTRCLLAHGHEQSAAPFALAERLKTFGLSKRESQVAELVFTGRTNQRVAEALFISRDTVKTHCRRIFGKLGISRRTEFFRVIGE